MNRSTASRTSSSPARGVLVYRTLVGALSTRGRVLALTGLGTLGIVLALALRLTNPVDRVGAAYSLIDGFGLSLLVPVVALVFASASLGDPSEDGTLVYLWLRPIPRWQLAVAAFAASLTVSLPVAVLPTVVAAVVCGVGRPLIGAAAAGGLLAAVAYSAVFCGLGLRVRRALAWGLGYLLIWEQAVARVSKGAGRLSIYVNARSVAAYIANHRPPRPAVSVGAGVVLPIVITIVAVVLTGRSLNRGELA